MGIGEGIRNMRKKNKLTMEQLAKNLNTRFPHNSNFTKSKISKWENEKEEPRLSSAKQIADYFNVPLDRLYNNDNSTKTQNQSNKDKIAAHVSEDVTEAEMKEIINYLNYVKSKRNKYISDK
ncbi:helix-turn-helix domain-containing protein [Staphylococcus schweitzeri]|uniref:Phage repressor protein n=1 Tax=Staphylococcus schweitzeri TaxID=1654388 RepID=A0A077UD91_9STAP|nr:helix-turn-helix transcriptional regulator [Staphylococcus schweitzeri]CDR26481.1 phage repressor protein [Staphylococcus schweitzeri]